MDVKLRKSIGVFTILLSITFMLYGAMRGEVDTVLSKAIRICLECVGIA